MQFSETCSNFLKHIFDLACYSVFWHVNILKHENYVPIVWIRLQMPYRFFKHSDVYNFTTVCPV